MNRFRKRKKEEGLKKRDACEDGGELSVYFYFHFLIVFFFFCRNFEMVVVAMGESEIYEGMYGHTRKLETGRDMRG